MRGSVQETAPRKTAENTVKHRGVGSMVANHYGGGESAVVGTTLIRGRLRSSSIMLHWIGHYSNTWMGPNKITV